MQQGQTLIGVIIAVGTITLLVVGLTSLAIVTTRLLTDSERHTVALGIVNERIEFIKSLPYGDVGFLNDTDIPSVLPIVLPSLVTVNEDLNSPGNDPSN